MQCGRTLEREKEEERERKRQAQECARQLNAKYNALSRVRYENVLYDSITFHTHTHTLKQAQNTCTHGYYHQQRSHSFRYGYEIVHYICILYAYIT